MRTRLTPHQRMIMLMQGQTDEVKKELAGIAATLANGEGTTTTTTRRTKATRRGRKAKVNSGTREHGSTAATTYQRTSPSDSAGI